MRRDEERNQKNRELCRLIRERIPLAEEQLVVENVGLVSDLAKELMESYGIKKKHFGCIELDDLIQEGQIALLRAGKTFDELMENTFATYAYRIVENSIRDFCEKSLSCYEIKMENAGVSRVLLDDNPDSLEKGFLVNGLSYDVGDPTAEEAIHSLRLTKMRNRVKQLPVRQKKILNYRYGLTSMEEKSVAETAEYFHLSKRYVAIIERDALETLRIQMCDEKIV